MFYREGAGFAVEEVRQYGPNVLSFEVVSGWRRWYIVGCYIAPDDAQTIERVVTALGDQPKGTALVVAGDLNTDLGEMECDRRGGGDLGGAHGGGAGRYDGTLPAEEAEVGEVTVDVGNGERGESGKVPDGLHSRD